MTNKKILYEYAINDLNEDGEVTGNMVGIGSCYAANDEQAKMRAVLMMVDKQPKLSVEALSRTLLRDYKWTRAMVSDLVKAVLRTEKELSKRND